MKTLRSSTSIFFTKAFCLAVVLFASMPAIKVAGQNTWYAAAGSNIWSGSTTWNENSFNSGTHGTPASGDNVIIEDGSTVTASASEAIGTITIGGSNGSGFLSISSGFTVTCSGLVTFGTKQSTSTGGTISGSGNLTLSGSAGIAVATESTYTSTISSGINLGTVQQPVNVATGEFLTISGIISGAGGGISFNPTGGNAGTLLLSNSNSYTGNNTINAGIMSISADLNLGAVPSSTTSNSITFNGGTLKVASNVNMTPKRGITINAGGATMDVTNSVNCEGIITGSGALTKTDAGLLNLSGANTYTATTTVNGGTLQAGVATIAGTSGAFGINSAITLANTSGVVMDIDGFNTQIGSFTGGGTTGGNVTLGSGTLTVGADNTSPTYSGVISGAGGITKIGSGIITLSGANTYTGATTINSGTLQAGIASVSNTSGAFGKNSAVTMANISTAIMNITGFSTQIGSITGGGTTGGNVTLGAAILTAGGDNTSPAAYAGIISGTGGLTKIGTGAITLSGANTFTGATTINAGTLKAGIVSVANTSGAFGNNSAVTMANISTAVMNITGFNTQIGSITGGGATGGNVTLGAATLSAGGDNTSPAAYAGIISGSGALTKIGTGVLILSGNNTYTGQTTINTGTLQFGSKTTIPHSSSSGNVDIASGAVLDLNGFSPIIGGLTGSGTVDNVSAGGTPGLTTGTNNQSTTFSGAIQNTTGSLTLSENGTGALTLTGNNTFSGGDSLKAGQLNINSPTALGSGIFYIGPSTTIDNTSSGLITLANNNPQIWDGSVFYYEGFTFYGTQNLNMGTGAITLINSPLITFNSANGSVFTVGGVINDTVNPLNTQGSGELDFVNQPINVNALSINSGTVKSTSGNLTLNYLNNSGTFNNNGGTITLIDYYLDQSFLSGVPYLNNLTLANPLGTYLYSNAEVNGVLNFLTPGQLYLYGNPITMSSNSSITGAGRSQYVITDENGGTMTETAKSSQSAYFFPIGDDLADTDYSPLTLNFSNNPAGGTISVIVDASKYTNNTSASNYLNRFWTISESGLTGGVFSSLAATYLSTDITGTQANTDNAFWNGSAWTTQGAVGASTVNLSSPTITNPFGIVSGINGSFPVFQSPPFTQGCSNTLTANVSGGSPPYTYSWMPGGASSQTITSTAASYTCYVHDATDYSVSASVSSTGLIKTPTITVTSNVICNGGSSGNALVSESGGTSPYTYSWNNGTSSASYLNPTGAILSPGTYTVTVYDNIGCSSSASIGITQPPVLIYYLSAVTNANCNGNSTGSATMVASGGTLPYTYIWNGGSSSTSNPFPKTGLASGTYTTSVEDNCGITLTSSIVISEPSSGDAITIASQKDISCNGGSTGEAIANAATGGNIPYELLLTFNNTNGASPDLGSLTLSGTTFYGMTQNGGMYGDGCVFSINSAGNVYSDLLDFNGTNGNGPEGSLTISGNTLYGMTISGGAYNQGSVFSINLSLCKTCTGYYTDLLNFNGTNGSDPKGSLTVSGNTLYGMTYTGGANSDGCVFSINNDGTGYNDLLDFNITNGGFPFGSLILSGTTLYGETQAGGANHEGCIFSINSVTKTYTHLYDFSTLTGANPWGSLILSGTTLYGLARNGGSAGLGFGCIFSFNTSGNAYTEMLDFTGANGPSPDGSLVLSGATLYGTTSLGGANSEGNVFSYNTSGNLYADLLDFNGTNGKTPEASLTLWGNTLYGMTSAGGTNNDGTVFAINPPFSYNWMPGGGTNLTASNLTAGTYTITATDANGCSATASVNITQPTILTYTITQTNIISCGTGSATVTPAGGTMPYTYNWNSGGTTASNNPLIETGLVAGTYSVSLEDSCGATSSASVVITETNVLASNATVLTNVTCNGNSTGSAQSAPSGGTSPYTYAWQGGATTSSVTNLSAGTFTLTVNDANNCSATSSVIITQPMVLNGHEAITSQVLCYGYSDGGMTSATTGGTPPYTYLWSNGATTTSISGLPPDAYKLIVTDSNGCYYSWTEVISQPGMLRDSIVSTTIYDISCNGGNNGGAKVGVKGGTLFYTYSWGPVSCSTANISGLSAGTYSVFVTDKNGCSLTAAIITLTQPASLSGSLTSSTSPTCNGNNGGATIGVSGGTSPYTYIWTPRVSTLATATGLSAGSYTVEIRDKNHCISDFDFLLTQSSSVRDSIAVGSIVEILCNGTNIGSATVGVKNGVTPYTYLWSPGGGTKATESTLSAGTYIINITDKNGCTGSTSVTITQPSSLSDSIVSSTVSNITCNGENNGRARVGAQGGKIPYTYSWAPVSCSTAIISGLSAGTYSVYVTDKNGCSASAAFVSITITQPALLSGSVAGSTSPACNGGDNGTATIGVNGGTTPYTYLWTPRGSTTAFGSGLKAGAYTVEVIDENHCIAYVYYSLTQPLAIRDSIVAASKVNVLCEGSSTGSATVGAKLGVSPYTYLWSPGGGTNQTESSLSAGAYTVTITDSNGCTGTATTTITQPTMLRDSIATQSCSANTGMATVGVKGGKTPYTYSWNPGGGSKATMSGLSNGSYTITIKDNNGCTETNSVSFLCASAPPRGDGPVAPDTCCPGEDLSGIKLYPNPNTGEFRIEGVQAGQIVQLYDYTGRLLNTETAESSPMLLNISNQANGVYLVRILSKDGVLVSEKKVVKTN